MRYFLYSLQHNLDTDRTLKSLKEVIQIWDPRKKKEWDCKLEHLKIMTTGHYYTKTTEDEEVFWIKGYAPVEK